MDNRCSIPIDHLQHGLFAAAQRPGPRRAGQGSHDQEEQLTHIETVCQRVWRCLSELAARPLVLDVRVPWPAMRLADFHFDARLTAGPVCFNRVKERNPGSNKLLAVWFAPFCAA